MSKRIISIRERILLTFFIIIIFYFHCYVQRWASLASTKYSRSNFLLPVYTYRPIKELLKIWINHLKKMLMFSIVRSYSLWICESKIDRWDHTFRFFNFIATKVDQLLGMIDFACLNFFLHQKETVIELKYIPLFYHRDSSRLFETPHLTFFTFFDHSYASTKADRARSCCSETKGLEKTGCTFLNFLHLKTVTW